MLDFIYINRIFAIYDYGDVVAKAKIDEFQQEEIDLAEVAKAIAHPARIRILTILNNCQTCITGNIVEQLPLSQSTVSQHLAELKKAKLIRGEIDGPKTCYCIDPETMKKAREAFFNLFHKICC